MRKLLSFIGHYLSEAIKSKEKNPKNQIGYKTFLCFQLSFILNFNKFKSLSFRLNDSNDNLIKFFFKHSFLVFEFQTGDLEIMLGQLLLKYILSYL